MVSLPQPVASPPPGRVILALNTAILPSCCISSVVITASGCSVLSHNSRHFTSRYSLPSTFVKYRLALNFFSTISCLFSN